MPGSSLVKADGTVVAAHLELADSIWKRFMGLMGRPGLEPGHGLHLSPCSSIHMFFMRFPIDAVFLDRDGVVLRVYRGLRPWRMTGIVRRAKACVELPAGTAEAAGIAPGDRLLVAAH